MWKMIVAYIIYLLALLFCFAPFALNMLAGDILGLLCGVGIFAVLTTVLAILTVRYIKIYAGAQQALGTGVQPKLTLVQQIGQYLDQIDLKYRYAASNAQLPRSTMVNPFAEYREKINTCGLGIIDKHRKLNEFLLDAFSPTDLTYLAYQDTLNSVLQVVVQNFKGIFKRISAFDYRQYGITKSGCNVEQYKAEIELLLNNNLEINNSLDNLILEVLSLDTISSAPLKDLKALVQQTKLYQDTDESDEELSLGAIRGQTSAPQLPEQSANSPIEVDLGQQQAAEPVKIERTDKWNT